MNRRYHSRLVYMYVFLLCSGAVGSGVVSDLLHTRALVNVGMLILAVPSVSN